MAINAPTNLNLAASSDAGSSNSDGITNIVRPTVTGRGPLGAQIQLYDGSVAIGSGTVQANGTWSITLTSPLAEGPHTLTAIATQ
ncbi:MAG TPA: Ig-like domain-containing protein, partial [Duganella sp.]|nr:Ig-like domain-containing protein [Duganella sp.]